LRTTETLSGDIGPLGYKVAYALAQENLGAGCDVVADSVNPLTLTRDAWRRVAETACSQIVEVEVVCSDSDEHRRRIETRSVGSLDSVSLTWKNVVDREYDPYGGHHIVIDTSNTTISDVLENLRTQIENASRSS